MKFETLYQAKKWFRQYKEIEYPKELELYYAEGVEFGDWILFQYIRHVSGNKCEISRPIYGIYVGCSIWDMALVVNIVEKERAWTYYHEVLGNKELNIYNKVAFYDPETESFPMWSDNIYELGHWKQKPNLRQLREALSKSK